MKFALSLLATTLTAAQVTRDGCNGATLLQNPQDPGARGPSPVGYRRFMHDGLNTAVWYPAELGSDVGKTQYVLDIREYLPPTQQTLITDDKAPFQRDTTMYEDLPLDTARGPYPVIVFVHGTAAWKEQSNPQMTHWASRGFVVVSQDHPGLFLGDTLSSIPFACPNDAPSGSTNLRRDTEDLMRGLRTLRATNMTFLDGSIDMSYVGMAGHSAGATIGGWADWEGVRTVHPWAGSAAIATSPVASSNNVVVVGGIEDDVVSWAATTRSYNNAAARPKRLVGIGKTGHLFCSNICDLKNTEGEGILEIAQNAGVCGAPLAGFLFDCGYELPDADAWAALNYISAATLEESLQCLPLGDKLDGFQERFAGIVEEYEVDERSAKHTFGADQTATH